MLAYAFAQEPVKLALAVERRKPQVTIRQLLVARIEQGVVKYQATFYYSILYSGVKSLRIDIPADVSPLVHNNTTALRDKILDPQPADVAPDCVAWSFTGQSELIGDGQIELSWEDPIGKLEVGKSIELAMPRLIPHGADRAWGQIVVLKAESLDVHESREPAGVRPIDPQRDLMTAVSGAAEAYEFHDDWNLAVAVTRYQMEEIKRTSIDRAVVRMVVTPAGEISVQALYRIESARQRLTLQLPAEAAFDTAPLRINGRPVALERGEDEDEYYVPLLNSNSDAPFLLELRYTVHGDGSRLDLPVFRDEAAVQKVYLCAYLPSTQALVKVLGPWSDEFQWQWNSSWKWEPQAKVAAQDNLLSWVRQGTAASNLSGADSFSTDGTLYVFSTLRPAAPPTGSLRLTSLSERGLNAAIFVVVVLGGLLLLPASLGRRALAVGALVVAVVLAGVFWPTLSMQILNGILAAALLIVAVVWTVVYLASFRPTAASSEPPTDDSSSQSMSEGGPPEQSSSEPTSEGGPSHA